MKAHILYFWYVVRHKYWVFLACCRRGVPLQGIVHDWSKFLPSEWWPYVDFFYGTLVDDLTRNQAIVQLGHDPFLSASDRKDAFDLAWLRHQHRNPHHWQHWILKKDDGGTESLEMPMRFVREMLADWEGAGRAIVGQNSNMPAWYMANRHKIILHPATRWRVENELHR